MQHLPAQAVLVQLLLLLAHVAMLVHCMEQDGDVDGLTAVLSAHLNAAKSVLMMSVRMR